jgi:threonine/homoserine efflux transporter RhtA
VIAAVLAIAFIGGLAVSIWQSTKSIAFPIIAVAVLGMVLVDFIQLLRDPSADGQ